ncbi:MmcQ/YjbR family DNA-binding protein [Rheinheimera riviphila]|uniref:MmcQ/YjbR family DNA-binding protein n=1 Tax=Rheinheimera riviphila TaxID=1834037 RepID=A0A437QFM7_9GAMM|nr:MmcQ/YjbR family DNA-binding protein [Rheinheimera riviphila]RVU33341.1 MmcQ/YjbR family DNA-binding protein [Rheinheimera riviphila]
MDFQSCRDHCLMQLQSIEDFPFGPDVYVYKVVGKIFAILSEQRTEPSTVPGDQPSRIASINLKCDPTEALMLRQIFPAVTPGYHMNKQHWNTVLLDASVPENEIKRMIETSYALVVKSLPQAKRPLLSLTSN